MQSRVTTCNDNNKRLDLAQFSPRERNDIIYEENQKSIYSKLVPGFLLLPTISWHESCYILTRLFSIIDGLDVKCSSLLKSQTERPYAVQ
jgi:hypothetical protein